jgi:hypothetical protein
MAIALTSFEEALSTVHRRAADLGRLDDPERRSTLEAEVWHELGLDPNLGSSWLQVAAVVDVRLERERWAAGHMPSSYTFRLPFIHAITFLFALDRVDKILGKLEAMEGIPSSVCDARARLLAHFPDLRGVRDSSAHIEDRARGLGKWDRPLEIKPVENEMVSAPGGALLLENLVGNRLTSTKADGTCGQVEVSSGSLDIAREVIQDTINAFRWTGPPRHVPT